MKMGVQQGTIQQLFAAAALETQQWHYHATLKRWFHQSIPADIDGQVLHAFTLLPQGHQILWRPFDKVSAKRLVLDMATYTKKGRPALALSRCCQSLNPKASF